MTPASWPIGMGRDFLGTYDLFSDALLLFERGVHDRITEPVRCSGLDDTKLPRLLPNAALANCARSPKPCPLMSEEPHAPAGFDFNARSCLAQAMMLSSPEFRH